MALEVRSLSRDPATVESMYQIGARCFGEHYSASQIARNWLNSDDRSIFLGMFDDDRLVAYNGFLAHQLESGSGKDLVFQSCHSATDPDFRGQGLFSRIIEHAVEHLPGDFVIGFPNQQSWPIFVKKLGFSTEDQQSIWFPCVMPSLFLRRDTGGRTNFDAISLNERSAASVKSREYPGTIVEHESRGNYIWGRVRTRDRGLIRLAFLDGGGCTIANPSELAGTLSDLGKKFRVRAVRLVVAASNPMLAAAPVRRDLPGRFIWRAIGKQNRRAPWAIFSGVADFW